jgi:hypothetical protein
MNGAILDRVFLPVDETGDDERIHAYVGVIFLLLVLYLFVLKKGFGDRAI